MLIKFIMLLVSEFLRPRETIDKRLAGGLGLAHIRWLFILYLLKLDVFFRIKIQSGGCWMMFLYSCSIHTIELPR